ncbi:MAG: hypothetical protein KAG95_05970 [Bacteroidales bacterium]|nr:hypothetical protein [Bacteroidales bacterium]
MLTFIKVILVFVIVYYLMKLLFRYFIKRFLNSHNTNTKDFSNRKEGEITVEKTEKKEKIHKEEEGEYVDYEDVRE